MDTAVIQFRMEDKKKEVDLEVPLDITAQEFLLALNECYHLGMDTNQPENLYMRMEYPIALLMGTRTLKKYGVRTGTIVYS